VVNPFPMAAFWQSDHAGPALEGGIDSILGGSI
jgi:hypothetical protein